LSQKVTLSVFKSTCKTASLEAFPMVKRFCAKVKRWFEITIVESKHSVAAAVAPNQNK
jgi:hypothetical protein